MEQIRTLLDAEKSRLIAQLSAHPFLARCRAGAVELAELKIFLLQQGLYSSYFTRFLCAMMANLPNNAAVFALAENLFEELGLTSDSSTPHYQIYRDMLAHFSLTLNDACPTDGTRQLIDTMFDYCRRCDPAYGLGALCLGAEALVPSLYADLIVGFEACGIEAQAIHFFQLHVECDDGHAETLADLLVERVAVEPDSFHRIVAAGNALVAARYAFFDSIMQSAREPSLATT